MKTKKIATIILATTLSVAGLSYAVAGNNQNMKGNQDCAMYSEGGMNKHHGKKHKRMGFSQLDLSDEQKQQMKSIRSSAKANKKQLKSDSERLAHQASMQALMHSETFDEEQAKALISEQQAQKNAKKLEVLKVRHQMFQVLTDEQKIQYTELQMDRKKR